MLVLASDRRLTAMRCTSIVHCIQTACMHWTEKEQLEQSIILYSRWFFFLVHIAVGIDL